MLDLLGKTGGNLAMVVHGGEKVAIHKPFSAPMKLRTVAKIRAIYDMRKFASVLVDTESHDESGELVCTTTSSILFRGEGGFGGEAPPKDESKISVPKETEPK